MTEFAYYDSELQENGVGLAQVGIRSERRMADVIPLYGEPDPVAFEGKHPISAKEGDLNLDDVYFAQSRRLETVDAAEEVSLVKQVEAGIIARHRMNDEVWLSAASNAYFAEGLLEAPDRELLQALLAKLALQGTQARNRLVEAHQGLVIMYAEEFVPKAMTLTRRDLIQFGNLGLMRAIETFDYAKGNRLMTYAKMWVKKYVREGLASQDRMICLPRKQVDNIIKLRQAERTLIQKLGRYPAIHELVEVTGFSEKQIVELRHIGLVPTSLDEPLHKDEDDSLKEKYIDSGLTPTERRRMLCLEHVMAKVFHEVLTEQEAAILHEKVGLGRPYSQISKETGLSVHSLTGIARKAIDKLRSSEQGRSLEIFLN